jgi:hypothetical protein
VCFKCKTIQINRHSVDQTIDPTESNIGPSSRIVLKAYATISHVIEKRKSTCKTSRSYQKSSACVTCSSSKAPSTIEIKRVCELRKSKFVVPSRVAAVVLSTFTGAPFPHTSDTTKAILSIRIQTSHSSKSSFIRTG